MIYGQIIEQGVKGLSQVQQFLKWSFNTNYTCFPLTYKALISIDGLGEGSKRVTELWENLGHSAGEQEVTFSGGWVERKGNFCQLSHQSSNHYSNLCRRWNNNLTRQSEFQLMK